MASSGGNSSGSTDKVPNSGSEGENKTTVSTTMDQRKRKRMQSNRESARRSRQRKQNHLDELLGQAAKLRKENTEISTTTNITTQHYLKVEAENSVLRAQMDELTQRLQSLNDILDYINTTTTATAAAATVNCNTNTNTIIDGGAFEMDNVFGTGHPEIAFINNNPWNMMYSHQPIMADMFQY